MAGRFLAFGAPYRAAADGIVRLLLEQLEPKEEWASERDPLTYKQKVALLQDGLYSFYETAVFLDTLAVTEIPTARREVPAWAREAIFARDHHRCLACGATDDLTIDHVVPLDLGGAHAAENFQTLCRSCNSAKGIQAVDYRLDLG